MPRLTSTSTSLPAARSASQYSRLVSRMRSCSATATSSGGSGTDSSGGAFGPIGHVYGWSLVAPSGSAMARNLSSMSRVKNTESGLGSSSDLLRVACTNPGWSGMPPATRRGAQLSAPSSPTRAPTWWTRLPPELSPMRNTREKSAAVRRSSAAGSPRAAASDSAMERSRRSPSTPVSMCAGRRRSGAKGSSTATTTAGSAHARRA
ncbi:hypothetical protein EE612_029451 [Oryza sativa]|nr:hypothetical protein EE612_029451 [Oryza sativa]